MSPTSPTSVPEAEADAEQVEDRLEEARQDDDPAVAVDEQVALDEPMRSRAGDRPSRQDPGGEAHGYSVSCSRERPDRRSDADDRERRPAR